MKPSDLSQNNTVSIDGIALETGDQLNFDLPDWGLTEPEASNGVYYYFEPECECGQKGISWAKHSDYCPLYASESF